MLHLGYGNRVLQRHGEVRDRVAHLSGGVAEGDVGGVVAGLQDEDAVEVLRRGVVLVPLVRGAVDAPRVEPPAVVLVEVDGALTVV